MIVDLYVTQSQYPYSIGGGAGQRFGGPTWVVGEL